MEEQKLCEHCTPKFPSDEEFKGNLMSASEVRRKYPRWDGLCPKCGYNGIKYASRLHYYAGDY